MTDHRFFRNPHFLAYARLLRRLHQLIREGADETAESESLREQMDGPAEHLMPEGVDCLNAISADFYTLIGSPAEKQPGPPDLQHRLQEMSSARDVQDYERTLDLVRRNEAYLDPGVVANLRGCVWSDAGVDEIAVDFFERAKELAPQSGQLETGTS